MSTTTHDPTHTCKHMLTRKVLKKSDEPGMVALACNSTLGKEAEGGRLRQENYHKLEVRQAGLCSAYQASQSKPGVCPGNTSHPALGTECW